jgi:formiminotetrahydrofolate cyclodeaminase
MTDGRLIDERVSDLVDRLSTRAPTPGGGSASALAGAMAAALIGMVVELTAGRPDAAQHETRLTSIGGRAARLRAELLDLVDRDAEAYAGVVEARRLTRETDAQREARATAITEAVRAATTIPLRTADAAVEVLGLAEELAPIGNPHALSDVGVAELLAAAAVRGALLNVEINLPALPADDPLRAEAAARASSLVADLGRREAAMRSAAAAVST